MTITAFDAFCGAGGSSTGLVAAGIEVRHAANHWALAIETHNTNHPRTEHHLDDLQQAHASWFPRTDIAWFSPECTNHSLAKGRRRKAINQLDLWGETGVDPAEERSRATMREVVEFSEYHQYEAVIVENVVDVRKWQFYDDWLQAMLNLGYDYKVLYLNAQFFGVPQSRDRFYAVFWKRGNKAPNLDFRPWANCPTHGTVGAVQVWKKPDFPWGRYGTRRQYTYRCPHCGAEVMPYYRPAADVIDWAIPSQKIGEREKPLKEKTIKRILAGLKKFGYWPHLAEMAHSNVSHNSMVYGIDDTLPTQTTKQTLYLTQPYVVDLGHSHAEHNGKVHLINGVLPTQTGQQRLSLVQPFITSQHEGRDAVRGVDRELPCITTMNNEHQLVTPPFIIVQRGTGAKDGIANPVSIDDPLRTITTGEGQHVLIQPFIAQLKGERTATGTDEPLSTIVASASQQALIVSYYGNTGYSKVTDPLPTIPTLDHHALLTPEEVLPECGFRMLEPHELKSGMSFPDEYIILGNKRDQVKQIGNAVCCNVAQAIAERIVESLAS